MSDRYLRMSDLTARLPISRPTIYRLIKRGEMPKPIKLGSSSVWPQREIERWIETCSAARDKQVKRTRSPHKREKVDLGDDLDALIEEWVTRH